MEREHWMREALLLAEEAGAGGEVPVGCVITDAGGRIVGRGRNRRESSRDATAHAEMEAIREACAVIGDWRLDDCSLFVTLEPCPMCAGAILNSRISRVVYGSPDTRFGGCGTTIDVISGNALKRAVEVTGGVLADECLGLLKGFFQQMRLEKGDSGNKGI